MLLDGKTLATNIRTQLKQRIQQAQTDGLQPPGLAVILIGDDPASHVYVRYKERACRECGIHSETHRYSADTSLTIIEDLIDDLNRRDDIHGILLQLPLPTGWQSWPLIQRIAPHKDVDGLNAQNQGLLFWNQTALQPCTPRGVMTLLRENQIDVTGMNTLVVGRSNLVGRPLAALLTHANATVTLAHSRTQNLKELCLKADLVVAAIGKPHFLKRDWFRKGVIAVDVGIHRSDHGLCGDIEPEVSEIAKAHTPVPGGVGPMTIATLLSNCVQAWLDQ